jgi:hypothetical protein
VKNRFQSLPFKFQLAALHHGGQGARREGSARGGGAAGRGGASHPGSFHLKYRSIYYGEASRRFEKIVARRLGSEFDKFEVQNSVRQPTRKASIILRNVWILVGV